MKKNETISVVIPVYNEEDVIESTIYEIKEVMNKTRHKYEIIVVNDGSDDKTPEIIKQIKGISIINHPCNRGYGAALKTGIKHANWEWILITDADGTYPTKDIPRLMVYIGEYDMIVGARIGENIKIPLYRKPAKWFLLKLSNYLSETRIPDLNSGMRIFRKRDVVRFFNILPPGFSFTTTVTLAYLSDGMLIEYVPIDYHERTGDSKIRPLRDGLNFILLIIRTILYFNPLRVFLPISIFLFLLALFVFLYTLLVLHKIADISVIIIITTSIQTAFIGLLADLIIRRSG